MPGQRDEPAARSKDAKLRIPPSGPEVDQLFGGWAGELAGQPVSLKLQDLDVICVVLGCEIGDLLIPEP